MIPFQQKLTKNAKEVLRAAQEYAVENGNQSVSLTHLALALLTQEDSIVQSILNRLGIDINPLTDELSEELEAKSNPIMHMQNASILQLYITPELAQVLEEAQHLLSKTQAQYIKVEHIFIALLKKSGALKGIFEKYDLTSDRVLGVMEEFEKNPELNKELNSKKNLDKYGKNITELARNNKLDPIIGRSQEINRVIQILSRRTKNNPVLIGEPGTGKTAILEGLAQRIVANDVPESMRGKELLSIDLGSVLAGTRFRGDFEERFKNIIKEVQSAKGKYILFIDEMHTLVGAGASDGAMDASNLLKPPLARGELKLIGATTLKEYQRYIEKDGALARRFQPIYVAEPSREDTINILRGIREKYELFHGVRITDKAIQAAVNLSVRYLPDRFLPDKAIDLIDEAASSMRVALENKPAELEEAHRMLTKYEIEFEALKKEAEANLDRALKSKLKKVEKNIADVQEKTKELELGWKNEKETIEEIKKIQKEIELLKQTANSAEEVAEYAEAAELRYVKIPAVEKRFKDRQSYLKRIQKNRQILKEEVMEEDIAEIISKWTGVPITKMLDNEAKKLLALKANLNSSVIGQSAAVDSVASAVKRSKVGIMDPDKPLASFMFLGPTGVGKTELAKKLAGFLFDDESALIRFDMSEYTEQHSISKLIGSPPGYVGFDEAGNLTEKIKHRPYSVLLFDEIEKAHPNIFNLLLQILDDGHLTDSKGRKINFKNTIIILTSNIGSEIIINENKKHNIDIGFIEIDKNSENLKQENLKKKVLGLVEKSFKPEFINRLDEIIVFNSLSKNDIKTITSQQLVKVSDRLKEKNIKFLYTKEVLDYIVKKGYDTKFGARPIARYIQSNILNLLADYILLNEIKEKQTLKVTLENDKFVFTHTKTNKRKVATKKPITFKKSLVARKRVKRTKKVVLKS